MGREKKRAKGKFEVTVNSFVWVEHPHQETPKSLRKTSQHTVIQACIVQSHLKTVCKE